MVWCYAAQREAEYLFSPEMFSAISTYLHLHFWHLRDSLIILILISTFIYLFISLFLHTGIYLYI